MSNYQRNGSHDPRETGRNPDNPSWNRNFNQQQISNERVSRDNRPGASSGDFQRQDQLSSGVYDPRNSTVALGARQGGHGLGRDRRPLTSMPTRPGVVIGPFGASNRLNSLTTPEKHLSEKERTEHQFRNRSPPPAVQRDVRVAKRQRICGGQEQLETSLQRFEVPQPEMPLSSLNVSLNSLSEDESDSDDSDKTVQFPVRKVTKRAVANSNGPNRDERTVTCPDGISELIAVDKISRVGSIEPNENLSRTSSRRNSGGSDETSIISRELVDTVTPNTSKIVSISNASRSSTSSGILTEKEEQLLGSVKYTPALIQKLVESLAKHSKNQTQESSVAQAPVYRSEEKRKSDESSAVPVSSKKNEAHSSKSKPSNNESEKKRGNNHGEISQGSSSNKHRSHPQGDKSSRKNSDKSKRHAKYLESKSKRPESSCKSINRYEKQRASYDKSTKHHESSRRSYSRSNSDDKQRQLSNKNKLNRNSSSKTRKHTEKAGSHYSSKSKGVGKSNESCHTSCISTDSQATNTPEEIERQENITLQPSRLESKDETTECSKPDRNVSQSTPDIQGCGIQPGLEAVDMEVQPQPDVVITDVRSDPDDDNGTKSIPNIMEAPRVRQTPTLKNCEVQTDEISFTVLSESENCRAPKDFTSKIQAYINRSAVEVKQLKDLTDEFKLKSECESPDLAKSLKANLMATLQSLNKFAQVVDLRLLEIQSTSQEPNENEPFFANSQSMLNTETMAQYFKLLVECESAAVPTEVREDTSSAWNIIRLRLVRILRHGCSQKSVVHQDLTIMNTIKRACGIVSDGISEDVLLRCCDSIANFQLPIEEKTMVRELKDVGFSKFEKYLTVVKTKFVSQTRSVVVPPAVNTSLQRVDENADVSITTARLAREANHDGQQELQITAKPVASNEYVLSIGGGSGAEKSSNLNLHQAATEAPIQFTSQSLSKHTPRTSAPENLSTSTPNLCTLNATCNNDKERESYAANQGNSSRIPTNVIILEPPNQQLQPSVAPIARIHNDQRVALTARFSVQSTSSSGLPPGNQPTPRYINSEASSQNSRSYHNSDAVDWNTQQLRNNFNPPFGHQANAMSRPNHYGSVRQHQKQQFGFHSGQPSYHGNQQSYQQNYQTLQLQSNNVGTSSRYQSQPNQASLPNQPPNSTFGDNPLQFSTPYYFNQ